MQPSGAINDRQSAGISHRRPPPVLKNRRKFLGSHLCAGIMIMRANYDLAHPAHKSCSLSVKRAH